MSQHTQVMVIDEHVGRIWTPPDALKLISYPGKPVRRLHGPGEIGLFLMKHFRPVYEGRGDNPFAFLRRLELLTLSLTHNERVDSGAQEQAIQVFAGGGTPASPSATLYPGKVIAVATTGFTTKTKTDLSIGSASANVTTNEFTTIGLSRAAATAQIGGNYTAPSTLGGTFAQLITKTFTATGGGTAHGAATYDSATVSGSILYLEDQFASDAILVTNDTLAVSITVSN